MCQQQGLNASMMTSNSSMIAVLRSMGSTKGQATSRRRWRWQRGPGTHDRRCSDCKAQTKAKAGPETEEKTWRSLGQEVLYMYCRA